MTNSLPFDKKALSPELAFSCASPAAESTSLFFSIPEEEKGGKESRGDEKLPSILKIARSPFDCLEKRGVHQDFECFFCHQN